MKRKGRGGFREKNEVSKKNVAFIAAPSKLQEAAAKPAAIDSIPVSLLPISLRCLHATCQFAHTLFQATTSAPTVVDTQRSLLASTVGAAADVLEVTSGGLDDGRQSKRWVRPSMWTLSAHLVKDQYLAMLASLHVAIGIHSGVRTSSSLNVERRSDILFECTRVFGAALPVTAAGSVVIDLSTLVGVQQATSIFLALVLPCRRWDRGGLDSTGDWLTWGLAFQRIGRHHGTVREEAAQVAASCGEGHIAGWLQQCALLWHKTLTSTDAAAGVAPLCTSATANSVFAARPLLGHAFLAVPVGGLSGSPHIDKWRVEEASAPTIPSRAHQVPLVWAGGDFHMALKAARDGVSPLTLFASKGLPSPFAAAEDVVSVCHEPSMNYLVSLLGTLSSTPAAPLVAASSKAALATLMAPGSALVLSSTEGSRHSAPRLGVKRERGNVVNAIKQEDADLGDPTPPCVVTSSTRIGSRADLMGLLTRAMQEGEGIPPFLRYIQRLSKDLPSLSPNNPSSTAPLPPAEGIFPTLADLPPCILDPRLWVSSRDALRGYNKRVQAEIQECFDKHVSPPPSRGGSGGGSSRRGWIFPVVLWAVDGPVMAVLLQQWVAGAPSGMSDGPLLTMCQHLVSTAFSSCGGAVGYSGDGALLGRAVALRSFHGPGACSIVVDHALLHILGGTPQNDAPFADVLRTAVALQEDISKGPPASHGLLVWFYGGFEGDQTAFYPAAAFRTR